jgi:hypothetical protein
MAGPPDASGCTPHRSTTPTPCATTIDVVFGHLQRRTNTRHLRRRARIASPNAGKSAGSRDRRGNSARYLNHGAHRAQEVQSGSARPVSPPTEALRPPCRAPFVRPESALAQTNDRRGRGCCPPDDPGRCNRNCRRRRTVGGAHRRRCHRGRYHRRDAPAGMGEADRPAPRQCPTLPPSPESISAVSTASRSALPTIPRG